MLHSRVVTQYEGYCFQKSFTGFARAPWYSAAVFQTAGRDGTAGIRQTVHAQVG